MAQGIKDLVLSLLWLGFDPWPGNFCMPWMWPIKQTNKENTQGVLNQNCVEIKLLLEITTLDCLKPLYVSFFFQGGGGTFNALVLLFSMSAGCEHFWEMMLILSLEKFSNNTQSFACNFMGAMDHVAPISWTPFRYISLSHFTARWASYIPSLGCTENTVFSPMTP